ncbi:MAG: ankyrin repeat domain-containing protein [Chthoniobacter sp.]|nr:ankyrin repeat domain-containing protein [Chthoniobacter sp.]
MKILSLAALMLTGGALLAAAESRAGQPLAQLEVLGVAPSGVALVRAVTAGQRSLVELFLAAKPNVNAADEAGRTPLLAAALRGDADLVARLLALGADPRQSDAGGVTPLMLAAASGQLASIAALQVCGASLESADNEGRTALHYAIAARQLAVIEEFFKKPAELAAVLRDCSGLAGLAGGTGDRKIIEYVFNRLPDKSEWSARAYAWCNQALENRDADLLRLLLSKHAGPPAPDVGLQPWTAYAVATNDLALLEFLLTCGADPDTALDAPGDAQLLGKISANFMRSYVASEPGMTPLMLAAGLGNTEAVRLLLGAGAKRGLGTKGKSRLVALYFACWANNPACAQALLENAPPRDRIRIEISLNQQQATFYKDGAVVFETTISTGRAGFATKPGDYVITDKHLEHTSSLYHDAKMPFFMRLSCRDFGLHEGHVTGRPASHGCVRLPRAIAQRLFKDAPIGTWVSITR